MLSFTDGGDLVHVANTWQEWTVTYTDGSVESFRSDSPTQVMLQAATSSRQPAALKIIFPTVLTSQLKREDYPLAVREQVVKCHPVVLVLVNFTQVLRVTNFEEIVFDSTMKVGDTKSWTAYVLFSGNLPSEPNVGVADLRGSLANAGSAVIQVVMAQFWETWSIYQVWYVLRLGNPPDRVDSTQLSVKTVESPYAVGFKWTPTITGTPTYTWPTAVISITSNTLIQVWTQTGTSVITLWSTVPVTIGGPLTTVTQTIGVLQTTTTLGGGQGNEGWNAFVKWWKSLLPDWLQNWWWLVLAVAVLLLLWILSKMFGGHGGGVTVVK